MCYNYLNKEREWDSDSYPDRWAMAMVKWSAQSPSTLVISVRIPLKPALVFVKYSV